jgi:hypothetical protein
MATTTPLLGTATALTYIAGDQTLASTGYAVSSAVDTLTLGSGGIAADDAVVTMSIGIAATAVANDVLKIFAVSSINGTTFSDAPADGSTDATHDPNMQLVDTLIVPSAAAQTLVSPLVGLAALFNGVLPPYLKIVVFNGSGAALTSLAGTIQGVNETIA